MDFSVIAASVGSFVVSERVIRAKASVLAVLSTVAVYDLCRHSQDPASLRVYRGPAMVAFTLSCVAASLRIWRRSGVACDELLFLPGTPYAAKHGVSCPAVDAALAAPCNSEANASSSGLLDSRDNDSGLELSALDSLVGADVKSCDEVGVELMLEEHGGVRGPKLKTSDHSIGVHSLPDTDSDEAPETELLRTRSSSSGGPVIVRLSVDSGPDAAAGAPIHSTAEAHNLNQQHRSQGHRHRQEHQRDSEDSRARRGTQRGHHRRFSDTDLLVESPRLGESDQAGGTGSKGMAHVRTRCNTHDRVFDEIQHTASEDLGPSGAPVAEGFVDEDLGLLEEGKQAAIKDGHASASGNANQRNESSLLDENKGLKNESMIRYLLCSQGERLRRRRYRKLRTDDTLATTEEEGAADSQAQALSPSTASSGTSSKQHANKDASSALAKGPISKKTDGVDLTYSPSGPSVAGAAVDLCLPVLFNFHMFVVLSNSRNANSSGTKSDTSSNAGSTSSASTNPTEDGMDPRILPLIFLSVLFVRSVVPPKGRMRFWSTIKYTALAPLYSVYFRDAFVGDVMTSLVKPIMDLAYCVFYYFISVYMILSVHHTLDEAGEILEKSWALHNVVLPAIAVLPLWWKFLQTLRQAWDHDKRWPYLGNAFKYLSAALVVMYGMAHREGKRSWWWVASFLLATLYQIWWDTFMDWELLVVAPKRRDGVDGSGAQSPSMRMCSCESCDCNCISSIPASAYILLPLHRRLIQPVTDAWRRLHHFCSHHTLALRSHRLYRRDQFYVRVFTYNFLSRWIWMLSFIPAYHFSRDGREVRTFAIDAKTFVGAALSVAEIVRRCLWGILKLELETIKVTDYAPVPTEEDGSSPATLAQADEKFGGKSQPKSGVDMVLSALRFESQSLMVQSSASGEGSTTLPASSAGSRRVGRFKCNFSGAFWRRCFFLELLCWAASFVGLGILVVWIM